MKKELTGNLILKNKGFTLIELLIVIAIIGVLAATVIVSVGSQTGKASKSRTRLGVSSVRTLAFAKAAERSGFSGQEMCNSIYKEISGEKNDWEWTKSRQCNEGDLISTSGLATASARSSSKAAVAGEICCHASGGKWVIWSALPDADGHGSGKTKNDIYCADSNGFLGEMDLVTSANLNTSGSNAKCQ